jgi:type VI protein secretion system component Hcp
MVRLCVLFLATAAVAAPALAEPVAVSKTPAPPSQVPMPYPDPQPPKCPHMFCLPKSVGTLQIEGRAPIDVQAVSWQAGEQVVDRATSDPQEGGEVVSGAGQMAPAKGTRRPGNVNVSEIPVVKLSDKASATLATPVARKGKVKVSVLMGACATGEHFKSATVTLRGTTYGLHDVGVLECSHSGDNTDTCTLSYESVTS